MTNGAVMGAPKHSQFMMLCMRFVLRDIKAGHNKQFWKWGPLTIYTVCAEELQEGRSSPYMALPCVWFDAEWALGRPLPDTTSKWGATFGGNASKADVDVYSKAAGIFAYHFHNSDNWTGVVSPNSLSSQLIREFEHSLDLESIG